jgi:hypothetical protein
VTSTPIVPFTLPDIHGGFTEIKGAVYLDEEFVVFDLEIAVMGGLSKKQRTIKIEPTALASISIRNGLVRDKICARPKTVDLLGAMPGNHLGEVCLRVWRTRREDAQNLVQAVQDRMHP